jgi:hypothetical protein
MRDYATAARKYRLYAQVLRAIADDEDVATSSSKLRSIADDYERMAACAEAVTDSHEKLKPNDRTAG